MTEMSSLLPNLTTGLPLPTMKQTQGRSNNQSTVVENDVNNWTLDKTSK